MQCPQCSTENAAGAKFCQECGQRLEQACPRCSQPVPPTARFCSHCGARLVAPPASAAATPGAAPPAPASARLAQLQRAAPAALRDKVLAARPRVEGERKLVTVLFTDIVGSTALAERLDPEEYGEIVSGAHERVIQAVYRYEGTVAQLLGDGVLAFFGAPVAHEDDPVRAVNAGLDVLKAIGEYSRELAAPGRADRFQMRVGINTGLVVVGAIGSDLHMEYLAVGDTVNLAARLQSVALPGSMVISASTARLARHAFDLAACGPYELKGKAEPVPAFLVVGRKAVAESPRGIEGLRSPLVGREREMATLRARLEELARGRGQIVSVMGEAGLGKSRLVAEARHLGAPVRWLEGRCLAYAASTPYTPFVELLGGLFELHPEQPDEERYALVSGWVGELLPGRELEVAPFLGALLKLRLTGEDLERVRYLEPPHLRDRVFQAVGALLGRLAQDRPLALVLEDLHWADSTSLELLEQLMALTERAPLMLLGLFRPERQEPSWRFHEVAGRDYAHRYIALGLEPLDEAESRALVANLLHIEDLPERTRALILRKAEGNPFFVEEVIRSLLDSGLVVRENSHWRATREIEHLSVPDTLAGVIAARLDRLDEEAKRVAQTASVLGREFGYELLASVHGAQDGLDRALSTLQRRELVREKERVPRFVYLFKHALTQETAYASILMSRRRELHRRAAECLARSDPDRADEIARHFLEAQEEARALPYLVEAGDRAARTYATREASSLYARALDILQTVVDLGLARRAYEGLGGALGLANEPMGAVANYEAMLAYGQRHGDVPMQVSALNKIARTVLWLGQFERVEQCLLEAERLGRQQRDLGGLAELYTVRCGICTFQGDFGGAVRYLGESVQIGRELNIKEQLVFGLTHIANTMTYMVRLDEAWQNAQEARRLAEELGDRAHLAELLAEPIAFHYLSQGDLEAARRSAEEGRELARQIGLVVWEASGAWMLGIIAQLRGEYERAAGSYEQALVAARATGMVFLEAMVLCSLGASYLDMGGSHAQQAASLHARALELLEQPTGMPGGGTGWLEVGFCALEQGELERAAGFFQRGLDTPTMMGLLEKARYLVGAALVALERHEPAQARALVDEARAWAEARGLRHLAPLVALAEGRVARALGELERAVERFEAAEALALGMGMRPLVWQARAGAAGALAALGRAELAEARRRAALATIDEIAGLFADQGLRAPFLESAHRRLERSAR